MLNKKILKPITGRQIQEWIPNASILKYSELKNYNSLPKLPLVLLYEIKHNFGHWVTILKTPEGIEHFDSYGYAPDDEFDFVPEPFKYESNQDYKYLLNLLYNSGNEINYNPYPLQGGDKIATCGRWVILRNILNRLTSDQFKKAIIEKCNELKINPDELVATLI